MHKKLHPYSGKLVVVEGLDGSGKSTQIYLLRRWLENQQVKVFFTEWNSSEMVKTATTKGKKRRLLTPTTFSLIHATDFADRYENEILPLLKAGYIVLADRYIYTAYARDITRGCSKSWVDNLYSFAVKPDIALYFNVPLNVALDRILSGRPKLKHFEAGMDLNLASTPEESFGKFQKKIATQYNKLNRMGLFHEIDASDPIEVQQNKVRQLISKHINLSKFKKYSSSGVHE